MSAEEYMPVSESRQTVEKKAKPRLSTAELTTIESPGRSVPAKNLERSRKKATKRKEKFGGKKTRARKAKRQTSEKIMIEEPKREFVLIITEKPQAAFKIASSLGKARKYSENAVPFYELERDGQKIMVASTVGHLFNLTYAEGQKGWPIFRTTWVPSFKKIKFTRNYYNLLKKLEKRAKEFVIATDYDIEGEVIGWNVVRFILKKDNAKRMKFSTLTKPELVNSFENLKPTLNWGQAYAGETRHEVDWLYGINLSRALMSAIKRTGSFKILSIGRVQGPALKIIVKREKEISDFNPEPFWQVFALAEGIEFKHPKDIFDKKELESFKNLREGEAETKKKKESIPPPSPFDLTTLQRESYNLHRISPSNSLKIAQSLYLDGLISYPRTSSQKIPKEINPKQILKQLSLKFPEASSVDREIPVEGKKSDPAHPSIYPTGEMKSLQDNEKKVYELIVKRFISCFKKDAQIERKQIVLNAEGKKFTASALKVIEKGWTNVYPVKMEERFLPDINKTLKIDEIKTPEKETQPPKRYTPASLISLMEKKGLGTKTTRSMIVDILFERGYLEGKSIKATPLGIKLIEALEKYSPIIIDENLTKELEEKIEELQELKDSEESLGEKEKKIIANVERLITDISREFRLNETRIGESLLQGTEQLREMQKKENTLMPCPVCKKGSLTIKYSKKTRKYFAACDNYPECRATYNLPPNALIKNTGKKTEEGLPLLMALRKGKKPWEFKFDPNWKENNKEKEENKKD